MKAQFDLQLQGVPAEEERGFIKAVIWNALVTPGHHLDILKVLAKHYDSEYILDDEQSAEGIVYIQTNSIRLKIKSL